MPLLDSFTVDHTRMEAPAVRVAKTMNTPHGDTITVFDLRFCVPNKEVMPERHSHAGTPVRRIHARPPERQRRGDHRYLSDGLPHRFLHEPDWSA